MEFTIHFEGPNGPEQVSCWEYGFSDGMINPKFGDPDRFMQIPKSRIYKITK